MLAYLGIVLASVALGIHLRPLFPLFAHSRSTDLDLPNTFLRGIRFWSIFLLVIFRSLLTRLGLIKTAASHDGNQLVLDRIELSMPFRVDTASVRQYERCVATSLDPAKLLGSTSHLQLFLSALTEPAMLLLLAKRTCSIDPVGSVNVRNRFEIPSHRRLRSTLLAVLDRPSPDMRVRARLDETAVKVKRGWETSIIVELCDNSAVLYRQTFVMLQFARHRVPPEPVASTDITSTPPIIGTIRLVAGDPRLWAQLSRDFNPIHLSKIIAKAMGFRGVIAHGNHVAARAIQLLEAGDESALETAWMEVSFKRPVVVPVALEVGCSETNREMEIREKGKVCTSIAFGGS